MSTCVRRLGAAAVIVSLCATVASADVSAKTRVARLEGELAEAQAKLKSAEEALKKVQDALALARRQAAEEAINRARTGDVAAIAEVLSQLDDHRGIVENDTARVVTGAGAPVVLAHLDAKLRATGDDTGGARLKRKLCWLLGRNASALAGAKLRAVLATQNDANVLATALAALERCPRSPLDVAAARKLSGDTRKIPGVIGDYPFGETLGEYADDLVRKWTAKENATVPGEVVVEEPTFHCLGLEWHITGDANHNCAVTVAYRPKGTDTWQRGLPLMRCRHRPHHRYYKTPVNWGNLLAGSVFELTPGTEYEVKLTLSDPDGGAAERVVTARTRVEPPHYKGERVLHVVPGDGGGTGTKDDPLKGIPAADAAAKPGDVLRLAPGVYASPNLSLAKSGEAGRPIVWRGVDRDRVILDGQGKSEILSAGLRKHIHFEDLTFQNGRSCLKIAASDDIVVRRCVFRKFGYLAIYAQGTKGKNGARCTITDNVILGPASWKVGRKRSSWGVSINGAGHVVAHNRIENCWDCISLAMNKAAFEYKPLNASIDVCYNDLRQATDDGVEADQVRHNIRISRNRLTNTFSTLSFQPVFGGPGYLLYNEMINTTNKPFKLHVHPTGMIIAHNTSLSSREALTGGNWHHALLRNNIMLGTAGRSGYWMQTQGSLADFDYTGYNRPSKHLFVKFNNVRYADVNALARVLGINRHAVLMSLDDFVKAPPVPGPGLRADAAKYDLRLKPTSKAVDAGEPMPGINDGFTGKAPDLGCYETGKPIPRYGPRIQD